MKIVGLTGGICSGKSTVTKYIISKGFVVIDCDNISKKLYTEDWYVKKVINLFGNKVLTDGNLDKRKLSQLVFSDKRYLKKLEAISGPIILDEIRKQLNEYSRSGYKIVFIDAPTLIESKLYEKVSINEIWAVSVKRKTQISRLQKRNPEKTIGEIEHILNKQISNSKRCSFATYIINNENTLKELYDSIDKGIKKIEKECNINA